VEELNREVTIPRHESRRSFKLGVFNGALYQFAEALIDPPLVLAWFVNRLTTSNLLIGLVAPLGEACWFLPQIFVSTRVQRMQHKMPSYTLSAVVRIFSWLCLVLAVWLVDDPRILLLGFFILYTFARLLSGLAGLAFFDIVAKTIPARRRGSFFAWRQLLGGLLALGGGWIVKTVLNHPALPFPHGHAVLFFLYWTAMTPAIMAFALIHEPPGTAVTEPVTVGEQFRRSGQLLREDHVYRRYMAAQLVLSLANIALPFYGIYAKNVLGAPDGMVGIYVATRAGAQLLSNLGWGRLSDGWGNQLVMRLRGLGSGATALLALVLVGLIALVPSTSRALGTGVWLPYLALPLFMLDGAMRPAQVLMGSNFLLELVPEGERSLYLGLSNTLTGVVVLASGLGGLVVDALGFAGLFAVSLGLCLAGYVLASGLPEPRQSQR
jgi:hypothetical protein